jgi:DNA polymerase
MSKSPLKEEFRLLVKETAEQLKYLNELGVERTDAHSDIERNEKLVTHSQGREVQIAYSSQAIASERDTTETTTRLSDTTSAFDSAPSLFSADQRPSEVKDITSIDEASPARTAEQLEVVWTETRGCTRCPLWEGRTHVVNSEGNYNAQLMFVGEAPGADEDAQARPFVGRAGQLLNKIIESIGFKREDVFIGNVNRCRPPQNRTPTPAEAVTCKPYIFREIDIVRPKVIVVLGNVAMKNLLDTKIGITKLRGKFQDYRGIKVMPTFHPAYLLRDPSKKRETWEDMKTVRDYLATL